MRANNEAHPFTRDELVRAQRLHESGLDWTVVAKRIGHTYWSLMATRTRIKKGNYNFDYYDRDLKEKAYTEELVSLGTKTREIANALHVSPSGLSNRFAKWGLDREMRIELRKDSSETVRKSIETLKKIGERTEGKKPVYTAKLHTVVESILATTEITMVEISGYLKWPHKIFMQKRNRHIGMNKTPTRATALSMEKIAEDMLNEDGEEFEDRVRDYARFLIETAEKD